MSRLDHSPLHKRKRSLFDCPEPSPKPSKRFVSAHAPDSKTLTRNALERLNRAQGTRGADGGVDLEDRIRAWSSSTTAQLSLDSPPTKAYLANGDMERMLTVPKQSQHAAMPPQSSRPSSRRRSAHGSSISTRRTSNTSSGRTSTSAFDSVSSIWKPQCRQILLDNGILPPHRSERAANYEDIQNKLRQPRPSLSPTRFDAEAHYNKLMDLNGEADNEEDVMTTIIPFITKGRDTYKGGANKLFTNSKPLTVGNALPPPKPDFWDGADSQQLDPAVRACLNTLIQPYSSGGINCPNYSLEAKGPSAGTSSVLVNQAMYNGAATARGMNALHTYPNSAPVHDRQARAITQTYLDGLLRTFTTHANPPTGLGSKTTYHTSQVAGTFMLTNKEAMIQGMTEARNARDLMSQVRNDLIDQANKTVPAVPSRDDPTIDFTSSSRPKRSKTETGVDARPPASPTTSSHDAYAAQTEQSFVAAVGRGLTQQEAFDHHLQHYMNAGYPRAEARSLLKRFLQRPGSQVVLSDELLVGEEDDEERG